MGPRKNAMRFMRGGRGADDPCFAFRAGGRPRARCCISLRQSLPVCIFLDSCEAGIPKT